MALFADSFRKFISYIESRYVTSFRQKILIVAVSGLVLASIVYTIDSVRSEQAIMKHEIVKKAEVVIRLATNLGELPLISRNPEVMKRTLTSLESVEDVSYAAFYSPDMDLLEKTGDIPLSAYDRPLSPDLSLTEGDDYIDLSAPVFTIKAGEDIDLFREDDSRETREQVGWVRIGFSKASLKKSMRSIILRGILIAVIFTLVSSLIVYKITSMATKPLTLLSDAAKSVRVGKYPELSVTSTDELGTLTTEFNRMSRTIKDREALLINRIQLSSFVADTGMVLTQSETLQTILQSCTELMVRYFSAALARIWTYNKEGNQLELNASAGIFTAADSPVSSVPVGASEAGMIALTLKPHYGNDISFLNPGDMEWAGKNGIESFAAYPLIVEGRLVGVMEMYAKVFLYDDVFQTLDSVSNEIALCIQHKLIEWQIKDSLREKEVLLREIHHRVKNNMQVISSLLNFQTRHVMDQHFATMLNESQNRIKSMALIHEKLYRSSDLSKIDFKDYINSLAVDLFKFYSVDEGRITLNLDVDKIAFEIDTAIPCGLLVNEMLTNSLKHAFPEKRHGEINISLRKKEIAGDTAYDMIVSDNGVGMPEDFDISKTKSLGLQLIKTLAEHQLQGKLDLFRNNGTIFHVSFKELKYKKRL